MTDFHTDYSGSSGPVGGCQVTHRDVQESVPYFENYLNPKSMSNNGFYGYY